MIKTITATNPKNESITLELRHPERSGLYVENIDGLGPPKSNINMVELSTVDGGLFVSTRAEARNLVMTIGMLMGPMESYLTVEETRLLIYRYFPIKKKVNLLIETDKRKATISGYVEANDINIFSQRETAQISIMCPDPWFYEAGDDETVFSGVQPLFEFPFSNESIVPDDLLVFGNILIDTRAILTYNGDVDTGVVINIHALNTAEDVTLFNVDTHEEFKIDTNKIFNITGQLFGQGDDIIISTIRGDRYVRLLRDGEYINIIGAIDKDADWFQISAGDNIFAFTADGGEEHLIVTFTYRNAYGGI